MIRLAVCALLACAGGTLGAAGAARGSTVEVAWDALPVDLSFLNAAERPAGKRGFVRVQGDRLVFEDGTTARFWGTNLTAGALFGTSRDNVRRQARRLSALGFNLVRLHHHDSPWVKPNVFGSGGRGTRTLDPAMLEKLDWWIACLKEEGIYVWLDLHVQRHLGPDDGIDGFAEIRGRDGTADLRGYSYVNPSIRRAMKRFNEDFVGHRNVYTRVRYRDEPAIAAMLVTNENDVTTHFGNRLLPNQDVPYHSSRYMQAAREFADAHGLPRERVWRSWEHGASKVFLNDLEGRFHMDMIGHLRAQGVRVPIAPTSTWGGNPLSALPALTAGDFIDVHAYGGAGELAKDPMREPNIVHWLAAAQVAGKPLTVSEWNVEPFPVKDRHVLPLYIAAAASHQGWSAVMQYAYAEIPLDGPGVPSNWHAFNDPSLLAPLAAAALMFRRAQVRRAEKEYVFAPSADAVFYKAVSPANSVALRVAAESGRLTVVLPTTGALPWLKETPLPGGAMAITELDRAPAAAPGAILVSDTGELRRDWQRGIYLIDTPRVQAAMGAIGGDSIALSDVEFVVTPRSAVVVVQSLDVDSIKGSRSVLVTRASNAVPRSPGSLPFGAEPLSLKVRIRAAAGLRAYDRDWHGNETEVPGVRYVDGWYVVDLTGDYAGPWLVLR